MALNNVFVFAPCFAIHLNKIVRFLSLILSPSKAITTPELRGTLGVKENEKAPPPQKKTGFREAMVFGVIFNFSNILRDSKDRIRKRVPQAKRARKETSRIETTVASS